MSLIRRQGPGFDTNNDGFYDGGWWYSSTAYAIKWAIIAAVCLFFLIFFLGGYLHAKKRLQKGLAPLGYHRWMVRRSLPAFYAAHPNLPEAQQYHQRQQHFSFYRPGHGDGRAAGAYPMHTYGPPPPAYGHEDYVPAYTPPQGATKTNPDQSYHPPQGPPPGQTTGPTSTGEGSGQPHPGGDLGSRP